MNRLKLTGITFCLIFLLGSGGAVLAKETREMSGVGCTAGATYDPYCDVDGSGQINVQDITLVALHWGQSGDPALPAGDAWNLAGNAGTDPSTNFLGTTDDVAFEVRVNNQRALRIAPASDATFGFSPNLVGGYSGNGVGSGVIGATIGGGGRSAAANQVTAHFGTVGGGEANTASSRAATVAGGQTNRASGFGATVGGGSNNVAGSSQYATVAGGIANVASGEHATIGGGSSNTASGTRATVPGGRENTAAGDYSFAAGRRAKANDNGAFVWGDSTDADITSAGANTFVARASGGVTFYSNITATLGVSLAASSGSWASLSDRNVKADIEPVAPRDILARLADVPIASWRYDGQDPAARHIGPMAQDFYAAFGTGEDDRYISTVDADGVALAAIQGLYELVKEQQTQIALLQQQNAELRDRIEGLEEAANGP